MAKEKLERKSHLDYKVILAQARAVRQTPKGIQLTDRLPQSLKRELKEMTADDFREKQERTF